MSGAAAPSESVAPVSAGSSSSSADGKGQVSFLVCGTRFDISANYKLIKPIGTGAYGVVWYEHAEEFTLGSSACPLVQGLTGVHAVLAVACAAAALPRTWSRRRRWPSRRSRRVSSDALGLS